MKKVAFVLALILVCSLAFGAGAFAAGAGYTKEILANYVGVQLVVNGSSVTPKDANGNTVEPFIVDGTTYLPVRAVAEALGQKVEWDGTTKTVYIGGKPVNTPTPTEEPLPDTRPDSYGSPNGVHFTYGGGYCSLLRKDSKTYKIDLVGSVVRYQDARDKKIQLCIPYQYTPEGPIIPDGPYTLDDYYVGTNSHDFYYTDSFMRMIAILTGSYEEGPSDNPYLDGNITLNIWRDNKSNDMAGKIGIGQDIYKRWSRTHINATDTALSSEYGYKDKVITIPEELLQNYPYDSMHERYCVEGDMVSIQGMRCIVYGPGILFNLADLMSFLGEDCVVSNVSIEKVDGTACLVID